MPILQALLRAYEQWDVLSFQRLRHWDGTSPHVAFRYDNPGAGYMRHNKHLEKISNLAFTPTGFRHFEKSEEKARYFLMCHMR
jgi:hypothetical protein